jgi:hypothetical protein
MFLKELKIMHPKYKSLKEQYAINELAFKTQNELISSQYIQKINPPFASFVDKKNKNGVEQYKKFCLLGNFISNAKICLDAALGIINKKEPEVILPENLRSIIDYATEEGTSLYVIQNLLITSIFKYGFGLIKVEIPEGQSIVDSLPKLKVIEGKNVVDYGTYKDETGQQKFKFIVIDSTKDIFNPKTKYYYKTKLYTIYGLNAEGIYYEIEIPQQYYQDFDFDYPEKSKQNSLSIYYPSWTRELNFIPVVAVNALDCTLKYNVSFIQDLINLSLQNYRLTCNQGWLEQACSASHLVIKGKNLDGIDDYPIGAGAIHVLNDDTAEEYYVTPSTQGISEIKEHIDQNNALINEMQFSLLNSSANSSGEALQFRIAVKCSDLINLLKSVGNAITLSLENIDEIINERKKQRFN